MDEHSAILGLCEGEEVARKVVHGPRCAVFVVVVVVGCGTVQNSIRQVENHFTVPVGIHTFRGQREIVKDCV